MKKFQLMGVSLFALGTLAVAACSDQAPITGVPSDLRVRTAVIPSGGTVCSQAGNGWFAINQNTSWANPPAGGAIWVGQSAVADINYTKSTLTRYNSTFEVPAGATNIAILGRVLADNEVVIAANAGPTNAALVLGRFYSSFPENDPSLHFFPPNAPDGTSYVNFQTALGNVFGTNSGFTPGNNTVSFLVYNDDNPDTGPTPLVNPSGLAFCYVVTYTPAPPVGQGCSPGYWKNHNFPALYAKNDAFNSDIPGTNFDNAFPGKSFQTVLSDGGGGLTALGRATVSAYFNAVTLGANYGLTPQDVVTMFNNVYPGSTGQYNALKDQFEALQDVNGRTCPNPTGK